MTLIDDYLAVLDRLNGDEAGRRTARAYLETSTNIYRGHVVACDFIPKLYDARLRDRMGEVADMTYGILAKVMDRYLDDPEYRKVFDFDPRLEALILTERHYPSRLPFARIDVFL
ncbi:MAG: carboxylate--amine ligase, partial [Eggerthellaceae bacterium]|nr:carboxylate--amine ligase [Eggerthellaceae bacterium]